MKTELTAAEEKEFTLLNCLAFDKVRLDGLANETIPPMWLCMSEEAKAEARRSVMDLLSGKFMVAINCEDDLNRVIPYGVASFASQVAMWRLMELERKQARESGNPRAFFAG